MAEFDENLGWGTVALDDGRCLPFHLTQIADGTRTITAGTAVAFRVVPGLLGRWEAADLVVRQHDD